GLGAGGARLRRRDRRAEPRRPGARVQEDAGGVGRPLAGPHLPGGAPAQRRRLGPPAALEQRRRRVRRPPARRPRRRQLPGGVVAVAARGLLAGAGTAPGPPAAAARRPIGRRGRIAVRAGVGVLALFLLALTLRSLLGQRDLGRSAAAAGRSDTAAAVDDALR